jgi:DNA polymerase-4
MANKNKRLYCSRLFDTITIMFFLNEELKRTVVHMDLDCFFVSVSRLLNSKLNGKPVIVGGGERGVVAACSYETRSFGVHSAMPMKQALRLCPEAIVIRGDYDAYSKHSDMVTQIIQEQVPLYERSSIDEFYMDMSGMDKFFGCYKYATELRQKIIRETGLPISFGMSKNKTVSKIATDEAKPNNQMKVDFGEEKNFLAPLSVKKIPMVGEKTYTLLRSMGVEKVYTVQQMPMELMENVLGENGISIWKKANGIDHTAVEPYVEQKSMSQEETFEQDTIDVNKLKSVLVAMTEKLCFRLRSERKVTSCVSVKIRYSNFDTHTMQCRIPYTSCDHTIIKRIKELFEKLFNRRLLIRLIGVKFTHLVGGTHQINIFEDNEEVINLYQAMDKMRIIFGPQAVQRAVSMNNSLRTFNPFNGVSSSPDKDKKLSDNDFEYQVVISIPVPLHNSVKIIKKYFADTYHFPRAERCPSHILLAQFTMDKNREEEIISAIETLCMQQPPADIRLRGFRFATDHSLFINISNPYTLIGFIKGLKTTLAVAKSRSHFNFQPHIVIANGFSEDVWNKAKPVFEKKEYEHSFIAHSVTLLKRKDAFEKSLIRKEFDFCDTRSFSCGQN